MLRKRYVFRWDCQGSGPGINTPMTIDPTGTYFRRDGLGGMFIGGLSPLPTEEPETDTLDVDHKYFDDKIWPNLAKRVPAFESLKVSCNRVAKMFALKVFFLRYAEHGVGITISIILMKMESLVPILITIIYT